VLPTRDNAPSRYIAGIVRLEQPEPLDDALLLVTLQDVTYVDAPSPIVAQSVHGVSGWNVEIPFRLELRKPVRPRGAYSLKAEIRRSDPAALHPGDYLSTAAHPWAPGDAKAIVVVQKI